MPELTPFEERMLAGLRQVEPVRRRRRWLPAVGTGVAAAAVLVLTLVRPPEPPPNSPTTLARPASEPTPTRYLRWVSPRPSPDNQWADEVWIDDVHHTVRLKSPAFDRTFTDVPEPIALNKPGMPAEFAKMSPDVLVADQRTLVVNLPHTQADLTAAVDQVAKATGQYDAQVLADLLSKPGLSQDMRALTVKVLLGQPDVGLLDPQTHGDLFGRTGSLYVANIGPLSLQLVIDAPTSTLLSMNKDEIVNQ